MLAVKRGEKRSPGSFRTPSGINIAQGRHQKASESLVPLVGNHIAPSGVVPGIRFHHEDLAIPMMGDPSALLSAGFTSTAAL